MHRFIDLFAGIGGFRRALEREGMDCVFSSEIDKAARETYSKNFGEEPAGDICNIDARLIPKHDILCAGFPCQSFSRSGKMRGFDDERGRLFFEIIRIAKHHKPLVLILENVKTILTVDNGNVLQEIYQNLEAIGYRLDHATLNAGEFGIPQKRERVYFVAVRNNSNLNFKNPKPKHGGKYLRDIVMPNSQCMDLVVNRNDIIMTRDKEPDVTNKPIRVGYLNKGGQGERIYSVNGHAITLSANGGGVGARTGLYYIGGIVRKLHQNEAKAVMGFDRQHHVSPGINGYKQLGNAVIPAMINTVYTSIKVA